MESVLYRNSDLIVVLSKGCINYVKKERCRKVEFLPNSANTDLFNFQNCLLRERSFHLKDHLE